MDGRWIAFIKPPLIKKSVILRMFGGVFKHMVSIAGVKMANICSTFRKTFLVLITSCNKKAVRVCFVYFYFYFTALIVCFTKNVKHVSRLVVFLLVRGQVMESAINST